ncbi:hypothetical protein FDP41_012581 [Naegleria fowleri]|uniref:Uncharacterized protein n=1 Tax=Naegleria fowleri TaxID=5763 RepID=A0A6A5C2Q8_NAEFO|nr:uncharacterized protein FDP41_012581 [Naegleria fowleri]KAF0981321.1 hypothetical protein FDP41_012581 [Naegleria fowleri]
MFEFVTLHRDPSPSRKRSSIGKNHNSSNSSLASEYAALAATQVKISVLGSEQVGKTTLINQYVTKQHQQATCTKVHEPTVYNFSYATVNMNVQHGSGRNSGSSSSHHHYDSSQLPPQQQQQQTKPFCLYFSECSAREEYSQLRQISYEQTDIFVVCFRLDDERSFVEAIDTWMSEAKHAACQAANSTATSVHRSRLVLLGLRFIDNSTGELLQNASSESTFINQETESMLKTTEEKLITDVTTQRRISLESLPSLNLEVIDIKAEQPELVLNPIKSSSGFRPRLKSYSSRKRSQPLCCSSFNEKRRGCTVHLNNLSVGGSLNYTFMANDSNRKVSWGMIEQGRKELLKRGVDHVYYECCATNQGNVQFVIEECVREYYHQLMANATSSNSKRFSNRVSL